MGGLLGGLGRREEAREALVCDGILARFMVPRRLVDGLSAQGVYAVRLVGHGSY